MSRYEEATQEPYEIINELIPTHFTPLAGSRIQVLFDTKKKMSGGKMVMGRIQSTGHLEKFLTADNDCPEGVDYIMYLDKNLWEKIEKDDKRRIIFHELNHCDVDLEKKNPYKIKDHEITMFESEFDFNADDPKWVSKLSLIMESIYDDE